MWYLTDAKVLVDLDKMSRIELSPPGAEEEGRCRVRGFLPEGETPLTGLLTPEEAESELMRIAHSLAVVNAYVPREHRFESGRKDA